MVCFVELLAFTVVSSSRGPPPRYRTAALSKGNLLINKRGSSHPCLVPTYLPPTLASLRPTCVSFTAAHDASSSSASVLWSGPYFLVIDNISLGIARSLV